MKGILRQLCRIVLLGTVLTALPLHATWQWARSHSGNVNQILHSASLYVAVGEFGLIKTSTDGYGWVVRESGVQHGLRGVSYGAGTFVAVGEGGTVLHSPDAVTWQPGTTPSTGLGALYAVAFGQGRFVAVGIGGVSTSADGKTWTQLVQNVGSMTSVAYANGRFVAAGNSLLTSVDGLTWTKARALPTFFSAIGNDGQGKWVVVASPLFEQTRVYSSTDGLAWTDTTLGQNPYITSVVHDGQRFVAIGSNSYAFAQNDASQWVSTDGLTWTPVRYASDQPLTRETHLGTVIHAEGRYLAAGNYGDLFESVDAVRWFSIPPEMPSNVRSVAYGNGRFVAVGYTNRRAFAQTSVDGVNWTNVFTGAAARSFDAVAYGNGRFVAVGSQTLYSTDGATWVFTNANNFSSGVAFGEGRFVAVGQTITTSTDGLTWTNAGVPPAGGLGRIRYLGGAFYATGARMGLYRSTDAANWTPIAGLADITVHDVAYHDGRWCITGQIEVSAPTFRYLVATSTDGVTWTRVEFGKFYPLYTIMWNRGRWVAAGQAADQYSVVLTSADGLTWTPTLLPMATIRDIVGTEEIEVVVGAGIMRQVAYADTSGAPASIRNVSARALATTGPVILGFAASESGRVLLRAIGPTLRQYDVPNAASAVTLAHFDAGGALIAENRAWAGDPALTEAFQRTGAFPLPSHESRDAALIDTAPAGTSTAHARATDEGVILVEGYTLSPSAKFMNISALNHVGSGANVIILGFAVAGGSDQRVLVRGIGPTLRNYGVTSPLDQVEVQLYRGSTLIASNRRWGGSLSLKGAFKLASAFALEPTSADSALEAVLPPGTYSIVVSSPTATTGTALAEVYALPR